MGLFMRPRRPLLRLAAGATTATAAYQPGKRAPAPAPATDATAELERLARLHTCGALTDDEFTAAKSRLLGS